MCRIDNIELFNNVNNGVLILDEEQNIIFWNDWLYINTNLSFDDVMGKSLFELFPDINKVKLNRKLSQAKVLKSHAYYAGTSDRFLIPISIRSLTGKYFDLMQQDATISYLAQYECFLINIYDCTPYLEAEMKLMDANSELNRLADLNRKYSETKSEFLAHTSHELRTPLNSILGFMEILNTTELSEEQRDYLNVIIDSSNSMLDIVNSVMSISEVEKGILVHKPTSSNILNIVKASVELFYAKAVQKGIVLLCYIDPQLPEGVFADGSKIRQMLLNFISNAVKFTPTGGHVWVKAELLGIDDEGVADIIISVQDSGVGMNSDYIDKIFMQYERDKTDEYHEGSGVGLYICSKFAELMGTNIDVESSAGEGSTFSFRLHSKIVSRDTFEEKMNGGDVHVGLVKFDDGGFIGTAVDNYMHKLNINCRVFSSIDEYQECAERPDVIVLAGCSKACSSKEIAESIKAKKIVCISDRFCSNATLTDLSEKIVVYKGILDPKSLMLMLIDTVKKTNTIQPKRGRRVLVMEDNYNNQMLMKVIFSKMGALVDVTSNGEAGLLYAKNNRYDLMLIDINMPIKNGVETIRALREYERESGMKLPKIYALTAYAFKEQQDEYMKEGFDGYLVKPVSVDTLKLVFGEAVDASMKCLGGEFLYGDPVKYIYDKMEQSAELDQDEITSLLDMFFESVGEDMAELRNVICEADTKKCSGAAHYMKGQFLNFHLYDLADALVNIEKMELPDDMDAALAIVSGVDASVGYIRKCYEKYKESI